MSLMDTPSANRVHIGIFGRTNVGKSSLMNAITNQEIAMVSMKQGTTTDLVQKTMELLPLGPIVLVDTPGIDDESELGNQRVAKAEQALNRMDLALFVVDAQNGLLREDEIWMQRLKTKNIPFCIVCNKSDLGVEDNVRTQLQAYKDVVFVSSKNRENFAELKKKIAQLKQADENRYQIVADIIHPMDLVVLVIPIDEAAPKGRLILPQQQVLRDLLEVGAISIVVKDTELKETLQRLKQKPDLVITDSQVFEMVSKEVPDDVPLTSFSILMARYKGYLKSAVEAVRTLDTLLDGDKVLISEGCTHHRQCGDIGSVKLPKWMEDYTGKKLNFDFTSGIGFAQDLTPYKMIVHCGGCMLTKREVEYRMKCAMDQQIPFTNYGILIAYINGILAGSIQMLPDMQALLD